MSWRRTTAVAHKEMRHVLRDPVSLVSALAVPFVMLLLFGYALSLDVDRVPTLIWDRDASPESRALVERFAGSRYFQLRGAVSDYRTIERAIDRRQCLLAVVIPADYARQVRAGRTAEVQLLLDGGDSNTASITRGYAEAVVRSHGQAIRLEALDRRGAGRPAPPVKVETRVWYNPSLQSRNYIVPGLIAVILMVIAALLTSLTIAREWENGSMEQLLSTPLRPAELVLGKMGAYFAVGLIDAATAVAVGVWLFRVPLRGGWLLLAGSTCVFLFGALCWGILLSAVARSQLLAYQLGMLSSFLPAFLLSGFVFSIENMPWIIRQVTRLVPTRYFVSLLKGLFLKGSGLELLWAELALLALFAGAVFLAATRKLREKVA